MTRHANPTLIGFFIIGAIVLVVIGIGALAPTAWFVDRPTFISFFDESVNGLEVGAPVKFQGVPVGEVRSIDIRINLEENTYDVPVLFDINLEQLTAHTGGYVNLEDDQVLSEHIGSGLRAQLEMESIVTGLLFINLTYVEDPERPDLALATTEYPQIPTRPSPFAALGTEAGELMATTHNVLHQLSDRLDRLDVEAINESLVASAESIERLASSPDLRRTLSNLPTATAEFNRTLAEVQLVAGRIGNMLDPLQLQVEEAGGEAVRTLQAMQEAIDDTRGVLTTDAGIGYRLDQALESLTEAAEALRQLALSLERDPSMLIRGRTDEDR